jgi:hypothetical protein
MVRSYDDMMGGVSQMKVKIARAIALTLGRCVILVKCYFHITLETL